MKKIFANLEEIIIAFFLLVMVSLISGNVIIRLITGESITWLEEISYFSFAWVIFVGASAAYKRNLHGGIDLLVRLFPQSIRQIVSLLSTFLIMIVCIVMAYLSWRFAISVGAKVTPVLYISYFWVDLSAVIGFALMVVHSLFFIKNLFVKKDYYRAEPLYEGILNYDTVMGGVAEDDDLKLHVDTAEIGQKEDAR